jgi:hypothetical protein
MKNNRIILIIALITAISVFFAFDLGQYMTLEYFKSRQAAIDSYRLAHPVMTAAGFFVSYIAVTGLSLPCSASFPCSPEKLCNYSRLAARHTIIQNQSASIAIWWSSVPAPEDW